MTFLKAIGYRFFFFAIACVITYVFLYVLRAYGVDPEARGIWTGAVGCALGGTAQNAADHVTRKVGS